MPRNHANYTPAAVFVFDAETRRIPTPDGEDQPLRLWCARYVQRREIAKMKPRDDRNFGHTGQQLADMLTTHVRSVKHIWAYSHNLGYDLQATGLLEYLAQDGWQISMASSVSKYLWLTMVKHSATCGRAGQPESTPEAGKRPCGCPRIHFADTVHMWPMKLAAVGDLLGTPKLAMPDDDADESQWVQYCMRDVDVAMDALLTAMNYWDENKLGRWAITNAATAFNTLRHTITGPRPVIIDDPDGSLFDRAAIYGGRRQAWKHGELPPGRYAELDFEAAYATVGAHWPLPFKRGQWFDHLDINDKRIDHRLISCIAEVEIQTDVPRFPVRISDSVYYPVGRFRTILAGPEIAFARERGNLIGIGKGQWHLLGTGYQPHFSRILQLGRPGESAINPVIAAIWKQAGRTTVGKFAQHGYRTVDTGMLSTETLKYEEEMNAETGQLATVMHYGGKIWRITQEGDGPYAYPAVTAFVESRVRVALSKAAEMIGDTAMVLCDTDGLWCSTGTIEQGVTGGIGFDLADYPREARVDGFLDYANHQLTPFKLREKNVSQHMRIAGVQIYEADKASKASGRPRNLTKVGDGQWAGQTFPAFAWQQEHSTPGTYRTALASWQWPATKILGWCLSHGVVLPPEVFTVESRLTVVRSWGNTMARQYGMTLTPTQHPLLAGLYGPHDTYQPAEQGSHAQA